MPVASNQEYLQLIKTAKDSHFAYPAINVANVEGLCAAIEAYNEAKSDGFIQCSLGAGAHMTGDLKDSVLGAKILAEAAHEISAKYPSKIFLHTDHCIPAKAEPFLDPLFTISKERVAAGQAPLYNSHMFDGSELPLAENIKTAKKYLEIAKEINMLVEIETGVVGGEEDGIDNSDVAAEKLYTSPAEMIQIYKELEPIAPFLYAATFGNVHGVYKPGNVKLTPSILKDGQEAVAAEFKTEANPLNLVFHGGSGSTLEEIHETLGYGVIKMNVDTDTQYAFTRPIVDHFFKNYDGMLKVDGEVGNKKAYDPRGYLKLGRIGMKERIIKACHDLKSAGKANNN